MTRPIDEDAALEAELAALVPAAPSAGLQRRVADALAAGPAARPARSATPVVRHATARRVAERLLWACGGAAVGATAASVAFVLALGHAPRSVAIANPTPVAAAPAAAASVIEPPVDVAEESVAWADAGVQFIDDHTPARVLRRVTVERHRPANGSEYRVPRQDVILVPVALR